MHTISASLQKSGIPSADTLPSAAALSREQWLRYIRRMPLLGFAEAICAILLAATVFTVTANPLALPWAGLVVLAHGARVCWLKRKWRAALADRNGARKIFVGSRLAIGGIWALGVLLLLPQAGLSAQALTVALAACLSIIALVTTVMPIVIYIAGAGPGFTALAGVLTLEGTWLSLALAATLVLTAGLTVWSGHHLNRNLAGLAQSQRANRRRIQDLAADRDRSAAADSAKSDFLATMSHEIRTPMNGVLGMAELLAQTSLTPTQQTYVESLHKSGRVLLNLINDVLDVSKLESGKFELGNEAFDLHQIVQELEHMFGLRARESGLTFKVTIDADALGVYAGDPIRLQQILMNLISNAIKFTPHGEVRVHIKVGSCDAFSTSLIFEITDTGVGIPADQQAAIFDAFNQAETARRTHQGGTGLGLHITRSLIDLMGGRIEMMSQENLGTTFRVTLPLDHAQEQPRGIRPMPPSQQRRLDGDLAFTEPEARSQAPDPDIPKQAISAPNDGDDPPCILLAEDNPVNQHVAKAMLEQLGYRVLTVETGRDAILTVMTAPEAFEMVLMDCDMPDMDGFEATRELRQRGYGHKQLPIIALTASAMAGDRERCLAAGMTSYLSKPVRQRDLAAVLAGQYNALDTVATNETMAAACETPAKATHRGESDLTSDNTHEAPEPSGTTDQPHRDVLDGETIAQLEMLQKPGGPDIVAKLADQFIRTSQSMMTEIETAMAAQDSTVVRRTAHSLKSSSASVGALDLSRQFKALEAAGYEARLDDAEHLIQDIQVDLQHVHAALRALRDQGTDDRVAAAS